MMHNLSHTYRWCCCLLLATLAFGAEAQRGGGGFGSNFGSAFSGGGAGSSTLGAVVLDTSEIHYFYADDLSRIYPFDDSLLNDFQQYDPIRQQEWPYAHLGNLGSAQRPLFFQPAQRQGFDAGLHQYFLYQLRTSDIRYYRITQAYTQAGYTQGQVQGDAQMHLRFSRNFSNGINMSIEHRRINNGGAYDYQRATNSSVAAGLWYRDAYGRYDGFLSYVSNTHRHEENGGVAEVLTDDLVPAFQVKFRLNTPFTRHAHAELAYTHYYYLRRLSPAEKARLQQQKEQRRQKKIAERPVLIQPDSLQHNRARDRKQTPHPEAPKIQKATEAWPPIAEGEPTIPALQAQAAAPKRTFTLYHQASWKSSSYKYADNAPDSSYYGAFLLDDRGLRHYLEVRRLQNTFKVQTFKLRSDEKPSDLLEVGLRHALYLIDQEPLVRRIRNDLFLTGRLQLAPGKRLLLNLEGHLGVGKDAGDYRIGGDLTLDAGALGLLRLDLVNQLYSPSLLAQQFFVTTRQVWANDFSRTLETSASATWMLPRWHVSATGRYHLVDGYLYYDAVGQPKQTGTFSVWQFALRKDFHFGPLHSENQLNLQKTGTDALALPELYSHHSLYLEGRIFQKVMLARLGVDGRFTASYRAPGYFPLIGQFVVQDSQTLADTSLLDAFVSFKVKTFRFFLKIENLLTTPLHTYYFQTVDYPLPYGFGNGGVRFGISWRMVD